MLSRVETRLESCPFSPAGWRPGAFDSDRRLQRLESFVREHFCDPISLARAAHEACLARCYFSTYFRRHLGIGFHRWLTCLRIQLAARELIASDESVTEIAWAVGFQDMTTFTRAFRRVTGTTPSWFRSRYRPRPSAAEALPRERGGQSPQRRPRRQTASERGNAIQHSRSEPYCRRTRMLPPEVRR